MILFYTLTVVFFLWQLFMPLIYTVHFFSIFFFFITPVLFLLERGVGRGGVNKGNAVMKGCLC